MATKAEKPKEAKPEEAVEEQPKKKSKKKLVIILASLLLLSAAGGAAAYFAMKAQKAQAEGEDGEATEESAEAEHAKKAPPVYVTLDNFLVNLRDEEGDRYLQLGLVLEVTDQPAVDEIKLQMPRIRSSILLLLSAKKPEELSTLEGKQALTEQIAIEVRKPLDLPEPNKGVEGVHFSAFVIQ